MLLLLVPERNLLTFTFLLTGSDPRLPELNATESMKLVTACVIKVTGEALAAQQYLSQKEVLPRDINAIMNSMSELPTVVDC